MVQSYWFIIVTFELCIENRELLPLNSLNCIAIQINHVKKTKFRQNICATSAGFDYFIYNINLYGNFRVIYTSLNDDLIIIYFDYGSMLQFLFISMRPHTWPLSLSHKSLFSYLNASVQLSGMLMKYLKTR